MMILQASLGIQKKRKEPKLDDRRGVTCGQYYFNMILSTNTTINTTLRDNNNIIMAIQTPANNENNTTTLEHSFNLRRTNRPINHQPSTINQPLLLSPAIAGGGALLQPTETRERLRQQRYLTRPIDIGVL